MKFLFILLTILAVSAKAFKIGDVDMVEFDRENEPGSVTAATEDSIHVNYKN